LFSRSRHCISFPAGKSFAGPQSPRRRGPRHSCHGKAGHGDGGEAPLQPCRGVCWLVRDGRLALAMCASPQVKTRSIFSPSSAKVAGTLPCTLIGYAATGSKISISLFHTSRICKELSLFIELFEEGMVLVLLQHLIHILVRLLISHPLTTRQTREIARHPLRLASSRTRSRGTASSRG